MAKLTKTIQLMERIDYLVKQRATGSPQELANRLSVSKASLHRVLEVMKELGAPIEYNIIHKSYVYSEAVNFFCDFYSNDLTQQELKNTNGGFNKLIVLTKINLYDDPSLKK
ncbi:MAG: HTH domain-containing protein [Marinilabiliaceae bacterium]|nr:HTH domain-containing protein [Marinilabiliaceae bacterium]